MPRRPRRFQGDQPPAKVKLRGMACPRCDTERAWTIWVKYEADPATGERYAVRGKECRKCKHRFQTTEMVKDE